jgi:hypothetical protein
MGDPDRVTIEHGPDRGRQVFAAIDHVQDPR